MRTAMRRVKEDGIFKEWLEEQRVNPTFPVKPHPPQTAAADAMEASALASKAKKMVNNDVHIHVTPAFARRNHLHVFFEKVHASSCLIRRDCNSLVLSRYFRVYLI
jgi:hypothetical protein